MVEPRPMRGLAALAFSLAGVLGGALGAQAQQQVASVNRIEPQGTRQQRQGAPVALALGSRLFSNDVVETSPRGRLDLAFDDGSRISVAPASQITLDDYVYRPGGRGGASAVLGVARGAMRFVSGNVQRDGVRINTPTATIGIRGTDFIVMVMPDGATRVRVDGGVIRVWACDTPRTVANAYVTEAGYSIAIDTACTVSVTVNDASTSGSASTADAAPGSGAATAAADGGATGGPGNGNGNGNGANASGGGNTGGAGPGTGNGGSNSGQGEGAANGGGGSGAASGGGAGGAGGGGAGGGGGSGR